MDYMITKKDIYLVNIAIYDDINRGTLTPRELTDEEMIRHAVMVNNHLIDFETGQEIYPVEVNHNGAITSSIYANTMYIMELYEHPKVEDIHLLYAVQIYEKYLEKEKLFEEKKLIRFPQRCLFYNK